MASYTYKFMLYPNKEQEVLLSKHFGCCRKVSWEVVRDNGTIVLEDLNIKGMIQNHLLTKSVADVSLAELVRMVKHKAAWYGRTVLQVNRWFPSSKTCSECGYIRQDLKLLDRK
jgi:putative transposase